jgi:L-alanine-DL-glutamate epimerase-like enolase superfamily enzyme
MSARESAPGIARGITLEVAVERWPIAGRFTIARGSRTEAVVVVVTLRAAGAVGRGECVPYARYGESVESVVAQIESQRAALAAAAASDLGAVRDALQRALPAGAARNALDCAAWDLEAKWSGVPVVERAGLPALRSVTTAYTLSLGTPEAMGAAAAAARARPLLKVKLGGAGDAERIAAVRAAAPQARLIVDANESWRAALLGENVAACEAAGVELIEQPLPAGEDADLVGCRTAIAICADESVHDRAGLAALVDRYQAINIKLDKTGGLTEALALAAAARALGLTCMIGCMLGTSLAMAPALLLAGAADFVDLDGPLLLAKDRDPGLRFEGSEVSPPAPALWG